MFSNYVLHHQKFKRLAGCSQLTFLYCSHNKQQRYYCQLVFRPIFIYIILSSSRISTWQI
uniref:Uncharacterized protein n=1 Tax=Rhizophora mucronata TaxID=61149 RepID=A0A2P2NM57_RHIMU